MTQENTSPEGTVTGDTLLPAWQEVTPEHRAAAKLAGIPQESLQAAADAINATPPIPTGWAEIIGLPVGDAQFRVAREYDAQEALDTGVPDATRFVLYTGLGRIEFAVPRSAVLAALTAEVPYVEPTKAPQQS